MKLTELSFWISNKLFKFFTVLSVLRIEGWLIVITAQSSGKDQNFPTAKEYKSHTRSNMKIKIVYLENTYGNN